MMQRALVLVLIHLLVQLRVNFSIKGNWHQALPSLKQLQCRDSHWERACFSEKLCSQSTNGSGSPVRQRQGARICCPQGWLCPLVPLRAWGSWGITRASSVQYVFLIHPGPPNKSTNLSSSQIKKQQSHAVVEERWLHSTHWERMIVGGLHQDTFLKRFSRGVLILLGFQLVCSLRAQPPEDADHCWGMWKHPRMLEAVWYPQRVLSTWRPPWIYKIFQKKTGCEKFQLE